MEADPIPRRPISQLVPYINNYYYTIKLPQSRVWLERSQLSPFSGGGHHTHQSSRHHLREFSSAHSHPVIFVDIFDREAARMSHQHSISVRLVMLQKRERRKEKEIRTYFTSAFDCRAAPSDPPDYMAKERI